MPPHCPVPPSPVFERPAQISLSPSHEGKPVTLRAAHASFTSSQDQNNFFFLCHTHESCDAQSTSFFPPFPMAKTEQPLPSHGFPIVWLHQSSIQPPPTTPKAIIFSPSSNWLESTTVDLAGCRIHAPPVIV